MLDNRVVLYESCNGAGKLEYRTYRFVHYLDTGWTCAEILDREGNWIEGADYFSQDQWNDCMDSIISSLVEKLPLKYCNKEKRLKLFE